MTDADVFVVGSGDGVDGETDAHPHPDAAALETPEGRSGVPGTYVLLLELTAAERVEIGALGSFEFPAGTYAYAGSAFGSGGLSRVDRHREVAAGERDVRHWHVDYLTGHPETALRAVVLAPHADAECAVARALGDGPVSGFGSSDCSCESHLARVPDVRTARSAVARVLGKG